MSLIKAICANDFKHAVLTSLKVSLKIDADIYLLDKAGNTYAFEYYTNRYVRIVENPWIEERLGKKSMMWSNTYDSLDPVDAEINPWTVFDYPIQFSFDLNDILQLSPIT